MLAVFYGKLLKSGEFFYFGNDFFTCSVTKIKTLPNLFFFHKLTAQDNSFIK